MRPVVDSQSSDGDVIPNPRKVWMIAERCRSVGKAEGRGWSGLLFRPDKAAGRTAAPALHRSGGRGPRRFPGSGHPIVQGSPGFGVTGPGADAATRESRKQTPPSLPQPRPDSQSIATHRHLVKARSSSSPIGRPMRERRSTTEVEPWPGSCPERRIYVPITSFCKSRSTRSSPQSAPRMRRAPEERVSPKRFRSACSRSKTAFTNSAVPSTAPSQKYRTR